MDLWNVCVVPSLLNNCGVWINIADQSMKKQDDLQNMFVRTLFRLPSSTPIPALRGLVGCLGMKWRVWQEKLFLAKSIMELQEQELAKQVFEQQIQWDGQGWQKR